MNLGDIKAFMGDKPQQSPAVLEARQQIREMGLRQAASFNASQGVASTSVFSSQTTIGIRVYNNSLNQSISVDDRKPDLPNPESKEKPLFDFEEIAKNVLKFVGGAIQRAAAEGADQEKLIGMFEQARSGVLKGVQMAEKDLAGVMNDEIAEGIASSQALIEEGIKKLEQRILGEGAPALGADEVSQSVGYARQETGSLTIRTRDGDEVTLRFESFEAFQASQSLLTQPEFGQPVAPPAATDEVIRTPQQDVVIDNDDQETKQALADRYRQQQAERTPIPEVVINNETPTDDNESAEQNTVSSEEGPTAQNNIVAQTSIYRQSESFSFSVSGDLDEDELQAIGNLVQDAGDLANTFFDGDIDAAFQQALDMGYDRQELAGFALQLTRQEKIEVVNAYESVSNLNDDKEGFQNPAKAMSPISAYLDKMLNVFEQSQQLLESGDEYENMVNSLINEMPDVGTNDLVGAINRFNLFNRELLASLPQNQE